MWLQINQSDISDSTASHYTKGTILSSARCDRPWIPNAKSWLQKEYDSGVMRKGKGGGGLWDKLGHEGMCYQAPAPPCLFPSATCVEKKSVQDIRTAGEVLGDVLKQTKHYPALNLSRCFFSIFQEYSSSVENILYISKLLCIKGARA